MRRKIMKIIFFKFLSEGFMKVFMVLQYMKYAE